MGSSSNGIKSGYFPRDPQKAMIRTLKTIHVWEKPSHFSLIFGGPMNLTHFDTYRHTIMSMAISGSYVREYPHKIWPYMVQYLHFRILEISHWSWWEKHYDC